MAIQISGTTVIDNNRNLVNVANITALSCPNTIVVRDSNGRIAPETLPLALGGCFEGGNLLCCSSSTYWIVAPASSQVCRTWYNASDAATLATQISGCTGWFLPTISQLQNPGYNCRQYWCSLDLSARYWAQTNLYPTGAACTLSFNNGAVGSYNKRSTFCARAFRTVTY